MRRAALAMGIPYVTTMTCASATVRAIDALVKTDWTVKPVQEYDQKLTGSVGENDELSN